MKRPLPVFEIDESTDRTRRSYKCAGLVVLCLMANAAMTVAMASEWTTARITIQQPSRNLTALAGWTQILCNETRCVQTAWKETRMKAVFYTARLCMVLTGITAVTAQVGASVMLYLRQPNEHLRVPFFIVCMGIGIFQLTSHVVWLGLFYRDWPDALETTCSHVYDVDQTLVHAFDIRMTIWWFVGLGISVVWLVVGVFFPVRKREYVFIRTTTDEHD